MCLFVTFYPHHQLFEGLHLSVCNVLSSPPIFDRVRLSVCNALSSPPIFEGLHLSVCLFVMFYPHHHFFDRVRLSVFNILSSPSIQPSRRKARR